MPKERHKGFDAMTKWQTDTWEWYTEGQNKDGKTRTRYTYIGRTKTGQVTKTSITGGHKWVEQPTRNNDMETCRHRNETRTGHAMGQRTGRYGTDETTRTDERDNGSLINERRAQNNDLQ